MNVTVTDNLFVKTPEGLKRPSDVDGTEILCSDGVYRKCHVKNTLMKSFWTLYMSNGLLLELNNGSSLISSENNWVNLMDVQVGIGVRHDHIKNEYSNKPLLLDLGDWITQGEGTFNADTAAFATLAGVYATSGRILKDGTVTVKTRIKNFENILKDFNLDFSKFEFLYKIKPCQITELLKACFGSYSTIHGGKHYIADDILLKASKDWGRAFIKASLNCYARVLLRDRVGLYTTFQMRSDLFVNDLAHLIQFQTRFYRTALEPNYDELMTVIKDSDFDETLSFPVSLLGGIQRGIKSVGYNITVDADCGIYISGFYVK